MRKTVNELYHKYQQMETRSRNLIRENVSRNVPANYPGSGQRSGTRRSFRTPMQTLPLSVQKSASKSYVVPASQDEKETPKTLIAGFIESAETKPVVSRTLRRRRSERISESPHSNAFKSPRISDILKNKLRKKDPQLTKANVSSPGTKFTPRTNIRNFLAVTEQEQTPLERDSKTKDRLSDFISSGTKERRSGWGQKLSISPLHVSHSNMDDGFQDAEIIQNIVEKKTKRKFHLRRTADNNEAEDRPAQKLVNPTLGKKESLEKLGSPNNYESKDDSLETPEIGNKVEETDKIFFHQSLRSEKVRQESFNEQHKTNVAKLLQDQEMQRSLSNTNLHEGLDSDDESDMYMLQKSNAVSHSQNNAYLQTRVLLDRAQVQNYYKHKSEAKQGVEHVLFQSEVNLSSKKISQANISSHTHDRSPVEEILDMSVQNMPGLSEDQAARSSDHILMSSRSHHASVVEQDIEEHSIPLKDNEKSLRDNDVASERVDPSHPDYQRHEMEASLHIPLSKSRTSIRNLSLLKSTPSVTDPMSNVLVHSEYDLMESSSDEENESRISKTLTTPKSKKKNSSKSQSSHITKVDMAEKYNSLPGSPGSPYKIVRQSNADFRIIGQRSSTPVIRNKSFFHSTKVQEILPFDLTHNQTHLMENEIHDISPIKLDVRLQRERNFNAEMLDDAEMETGTILAEDARIERIGTSLSRLEDHPKSYLAGRTESTAVEGAVFNKASYREQHTAPATTEQKSPEYSKKDDGDTQQKKIQRTNRKRAFESDDDDDELPCGISSLNTPHFTMTKQPQVPSTQRQPKMKQTTLTTQFGLSQTTPEQAQKTNAKAGRVKTTRKKVTKNQTLHMTLPKSSVKFFAERHSSMKLSRDAIDEIVKVSETYWSDTWKALEAYALHAGRTKINEEDVILLMKTQRTITGIADLHDKIREYLPMELRTELIPLKL